MIGITARRHSPLQAEALADATATELVAQLDQARTTARDNAISDANDRAAKLAAAGLAADAARARQEAQDLTAGAGVAGVISLEQAQAHVVGSGVTAAIPPWLGWFLTLLVLGGGAVGLALLVDRLDPSIADAADAAGALDLPVLATVEPATDDGRPVATRRAHGRSARPPPLPRLRLQMPPRQATQLQSFIVPKLPSGISLAVAPVAGGKEMDDSSVVAVDLAAAAARSGLTALILDCEPPDGAVGDAPLVKRTPTGQGCGPVWPRCSVAGSAWPRHPGPRHCPGCRSWAPAPPPTAGR